MGSSAASSSPGCRWRTAPRNCSTRSPTRKTVGEEDRYSHTDLDDFRGNIDGSRAAISALRPVLDTRDPVLGQTLDARFADVDRVLDNYRAGDGFRLYTTLTPEDTKKMTEVIDALAEPVSQVAGVLAA